MLVVQTSSHNSVRRCNRPCTLTGYFCGPHQEEQGPVAPTPPISPIRFRRPRKHPIDEYPALLGSQAGLIKREQVRKGRMARDESPRWNGRISTYSRLR